MSDYLEHAPRIRSVDAPMLPSLSQFTCGGTSTYEVEVDELASRAHVGEFPFLTFRAAEDPADGALIGFCATHPRPVFADLDAAYVALIGLNAPFRGKRDNNGARFGDVLLEDALRIIRTAWGNRQMPPVWAMIDPDNDSSHRLFERHGFGLVPGATGGYDVRYLPRESP